MFDVFVSVISIGITTEYSHLYLQPKNWIKLFYQSVDCDSDSCVFFFSFNGETDSPSSMLGLDGTDQRLAVRSSPLHFVQG